MCRGGGERLHHWSAHSPKHHSRLHHHSVWPHNILYSPLSLYLVAPLAGVHHHAKMLGCTTIIGCTIQKAQLYWPPLCCAMCANVIYHQFECTITVYNILTHLSEYQLKHQNKEHCTISSTIVLQTSKLCLRIYSGGIFIFVISRMMGFWVSQNLNRGRLFVLRYLFSINKNLMRQKSPTCKT